ncbi:hypothetical protein EVAR_50272_1 [Eumeta japonica]|uniref:Uncharacterized protein n=1 Tax=Eumeta variegata TaxID=151549 RepID=A0A4C1Y8X8_EUMVA|nr:hypothetical protein EVAR_50272_1 [Eumeta japonica]
MQADVIDTCLPADRSATRRLWLGAPRHQRRSVDEIQVNPEPTIPQGYPGVYTLCIAFIAHTSMFIFIHSHQYVEVFTLLTLFSSSLIGCFEIFGNSLELSRTSRNILECCRLLLNIDEGSAIFLRKKGGARGRGLDEGAGAFMRCEIRESFLRKSPARGRRNFRPGISSKGVADQRNETKKRPAARRRRPDENESKFNQRDGTLYFVKSSYEELVLVLRKSETFTKTNTILSLARPRSTPNKQERE